MKNPRLWFWTTAVLAAVVGMVWLARVDSFFAEAPVPHPSSVLQQAHQFVAGRIRSRAENPGIVSVRRVFEPADAPLTGAELTVQQQLQQELSGSGGTHRLVYDGGKVMTGRLLEESADSVLFSRQFGRSGDLSVRLPRSRIVSLEPFTEIPVEITARDVRFRMEFPGTHFYKRAPYTIVTDESFFAVETTVGLLQDLYREIGREFAPLIKESVRREDVQLLIFSGKAAFDAYRHRVAPELTGSAGFYSPYLDRMVLYNQRDSDWVRDGNRQIASVRKQYEEKLPPGQSAVRLGEWERTARSRLHGDAYVSTQAVIRHEGAHQLLSELGICRPVRGVPEWVIEGLATWCETVKPGLDNPSRQEDLSAAVQSGELFPLRRVMDLDCKTPRDYAYAWALTRMLMQPELRPGFFAWLEQLRQQPASSHRDHLEALGGLTGISPAGLEQRWMALLSTQGR